MPTTDPSVEPSRALRVHLRRCPLPT